MFVEYSWNVTVHECIYVKVVNLVQTQIPTTTQAKTLLAHQTHVQLVICLLKVSYWTTF